MKERCQAKIWVRNDWGYQVWDRCSRAATYGIHCRQHAHKESTVDITPEEQKELDRIERQYN
jgi:hypothetical protein